MQISMEVIVKTKFLALVAAGVLATAIGGGIALADVPENNGANCLGYERSAHLPADPASGFGQGQADFVKANQPYGQWLTGVWLAGGICSEHPGLP